MNNNNNDNDAVPQYPQERRFIGDLLTELGVNDEFITAAMQPPPGDRADEPVTFPRVVRVAATGNNSQLGSASARRRAGRQIPPHRRGGLSIENQPTNQNQQPTSIRTRNVNESNNLRNRARQDNNSTAARLESSLLDDFDLPSLSLFQESLSNNPLHPADSNLPLLEPRVLPDIRQNLLEDSDDDLERFKCSLCWEFMIGPTSCGNCPTLFCENCLLRALEHDNKCPHCRCETSSNNGVNRKVQRNDFVQLELLEHPMIPCRFEGCNQTLTLMSVKAHECMCPHMRVTCRYVSYGCLWTGTRGQLTDHEAHECKLAAVKELVDEMRRLRVDLGRTTQQLMVRQEQERASMILLQEQLRTQLRESLETTNPQQQAGTPYLALSNPLSAIVFVVHVTCSLFHVKRQQGEAWRLLTRNTDTLAYVCNILRLAPLLLVASKVALSCFAHGSIVGTQVWMAASEMTRKRSTEHSVDWNDQAMDSFIFSLSVVLLLVFLTICFAGDCGSSAEWRLFPVFRYHFPPGGMAVTGALIVLCWILQAEFGSSGQEVLFLVNLPLILASEILPSTLTKIFQTIKGNETPDSEGVLSGRSGMPFFFAVLLTMLLRSSSSSWDLGWVLLDLISVIIFMMSSEGRFSVSPRIFTRYWIGRVCFFFCGPILALGGRFFVNDYYGHFFRRAQAYTAQHSVNQLFSLASFLTTLFFYFFVHWIGSEVGTKIVVHARSLQQQPSALLNSSNTMSLHGVALLGVWLFIVGSLVYAQETVIG
jgi:hypothetical protein